MCQTIVDDMKNIFDPTVVGVLTTRINRLTPESRPLWGKMSVDQVMAHCNVTYDMLYTNKYPKPGALKRFFITLVAKSAVVGPKPYPRNSPTAPEFKISSQHDFIAERQRLIAYIERVQREGRAAFDGRESHSFGALTADEWNTLFYKHLDHHLTQFGV
jgi:hypothetical protein